LRGLYERGRRQRLSVRERRLRLSRRLRLARRVRVSRWLRLARRLSRLSRWLRLARRLRDAFRLWQVRGAPLLLSGRRTSPKQAHIGVIERRASGPPFLFCG